MARKEKSEAAEKVRRAEKVSKSTKAKSNKPNGFKRFFAAIPKFWKDFRGEIRKIVWPDSKTVLKNTGVVLAVVAILSVIIYAIDLGLSSGIGELKELAEKVATDAATSAAAQTTTEAVTQAVTSASTTLG
ncbi:MAG: preprotein translocase subunit SecE [Clostridiales bacterium]|nr:preprotein translocase subunit SecE [Clostridiales bacterium]